MFEQSTAIRQVEDSSTLPTAIRASRDGRSACDDLAKLLEGLPVQRRLIRARQHVFHAGQPMHFLYLVRRGCFKTSIVSEDGREKITGFRMRGDLLGLDALDMPFHACDAVALDAGEVWKLPYALLCDDVPEFHARITALLAGEIRRDWRWMLALGTLGADQRVATFLLDLSKRMSAIGYSPHWLVMRMTRAEIGNFLALKLETVSRALTRLQSSGLIKVSGREISIRDAEQLSACVLGCGHH